MVTIYLDENDEITDAIAKVQSSEDSQVTLVFPEETGFTGNLINFKLLKKEADRSGKVITLVSGERRIRYIAKEAGLSTKDEGADEEPKTTSRETGIPVAAPVRTPHDLSAGRPVAMKKDKDFMEFTLPFIKFTKKNLIYIGGGVLALLLIYLYVFVPKATVTISPKSRVEVVTETVTIEDGLNTLALESSSVPGQLTEVTVEKNSEFKATGEEKAKGKVELENTGGGSGTLDFPKGTVIVNTETNKEYTSDAAFSVNSSGSVEVAVTAKEGGGDYNVSSGDGNFEIDDNELIKGESKGITGGEKKHVSENDFKKAQAKLEKDALPEAEEQLKKDLPSGKLVDSTIKKEIKARSVPNKGKVTTGAKFEMFITVKLSAMVFEEDSVTKIIEHVLGAKLADGEKIYEIHVDKITYAPVKGGELKNGKVKIEASTSAVVGSEIDGEQIKRGIVGKGGDEVDKQLSSDPKISSYSVNYRPAWLRSMPYLKRSIEIIIEIKPESNDET